MLAPTRLEESNDKSVISFGIAQSKRNIEFLHNSFWTDHRGQGTRVVLGVSELSARAQS